MDFFETLLYSHQDQGEVLSTDPIEIPGLEGERPLTLYLPPNYHFDSEQLYPIAYLFDGQNLYDRDEGPPGWNLHDILDQRAAMGLTVPIVVGIHHGYNRDEELCPWPAEKGQIPRGDYLLDWIVDVLHPQLLSQLRIDDQLEQRMVGGASLGGLLALYACFRHSDFFSKVMVMSPSLWVGNGAIYDYIAEAAFLHNLDVLKLYIDCGALEGDEDDELDDEIDDDLVTMADDEDDVEAMADPDQQLENDSEGEPGAISADGDPDEIDESEEDEWETDPLEDAEYLIDILVAKGFEEDLHFKWIEDPEGEHNEWHWSKRLPLAFAYLFDED